MTTPYKAKTRRGISCVLAGFFVFILVAGCSSFAYKPRYVLAVYRPAPVGVPNTCTLTSFTGESVAVEQVPLLTSAYIYRCELLESGQTFAIRAWLNTHGRNVMTQESVASAGRTLIVALDGWYHSRVEIPAAREAPTVILLPGPWGKAEAEHIVSQAYPNYRHLSGRE